MTAIATPRRGELVPLDERMRYLRVLRVLLAGASVGYGALLPASLQDGLPVLAGGATGYLLLVVLTEVYWRLRRRRGLWVFGALLMLDGVFLAWAAYETGAAASPVRYLVLLHLASVSLLASYRTGLKLALWHSLLVFVVYYAQEDGILAAPVGGSHGALVEYRRMATFIVALWVLTLVIATLSAVNERELRRRRVDLEALAAMGRALEDAQDAYAVGEVLLRSLRSTFGFPRQALFDAPERGLRLLTCDGLLDAVVSDFNPASGSVLEVAGRERSTLLVGHFDPDSDPWLCSVLPNATNLLVVPLVAEGRTVGVLVAETGAAKRIERRVVATTERFTSHAALALRNAMLLERMHEMAATDGLTGLANRRSFDEALDRDLARAIRGDGRVSVVLLDIDHFKALNDTHGHLVGDNVLRQVALTLREQGREYDTVARYGGEEFAVVLPGCSSSVAVQVAERLRRGIESSLEDPPVTASCGVATFPQDAGDQHELLAAADRALYASKRAGRNRVTAAAQLAQQTHPAAS